MSVLGIDLGGTKLSMAVFTSDGLPSIRETVSLSGRKGYEVGALLVDIIVGAIRSADAAKDPVRSVGVSVPGISRIKKGTVWAPNIPDWDDYPLLREIKSAVPDLPVIIDSDRACYIMGELWQGNARGSKDAIFLAVGTGIGAGIVVDGKVLRGAHDIAGSIGWMALDRPYRDIFKNQGCFEYAASGNGIARVAREMLRNDKDYSGALRDKPVDSITSYDVFSAIDINDTLAQDVMQICIEYWGMAVANLVSLFNPEKIIIGGGVFGPASRFIPQIKTEALKWAQPISVQQVSIESSALGTDAGVYGAAYTALQNVD